MDDYLPSRPFYRLARAFLKADVVGVNVRQLLADLAPPSAGERLCIHFPSGRCEPPVVLAEGLGECFARHVLLYSKFLADDGVQAERVAEFCVVATRGQSGGLRCAAEVIDNVGRSTGCSVVFAERVTPEVSGRPDAEPLT